MFFIKCNIQKINKKPDSLYRNQKHININKKKQTNPKAMKQASMKKACTSEGSFSYNF